jgi:hypothetical protein
MAAYSLKETLLKYYLFNIPHCFRDPVETFSFSKLCSTKPLKEDQT